MCLQLYSSLKRQTYFQYYISDVLLARIHFLVINLFALESI